MKNVKKLEGEDDGYDPEVKKLVQEVADEIEEDETWDDDIEL